MAQADYDYLRAHEDNLSEFVRRAVHDKIRVRRSLDAIEFLESVAIKPPKPPEDLIREDRDAR